MNEEKKKTSPEKNKKMSFTWRALTIMLVVLILYTMYHVFFGIAENLKTTPAGVVSEQSAIVLEGVIFRNEKLINSVYSGDVRPYIADGGKATVDAVVADVYSEKSKGDLNAQIKELEEKLDILRQSNDVGVVSIVDIESTRAAIDELYTNFMLASTRGEHYRAEKIEKQMLINMNKMKIYDGTVKNYKKEIAEIESRLNVLYASFGTQKESIVAKDGGYFYHSSDGYENLLTLDKLDNLRLEELEGLISEIKEKPYIKDEGCKFVYDYKWYLATVCDSVNAEGLLAGEYYNITLFDIRERNLELYLEEIGESDGEKTLLIFSCNKMPEGFDYTRYQSFKLDTGSVSGLRVPKEALRKVVDKETGEEKQGVYILNASVVYFKRVEIISEGNGYYIVAKRDKEKPNYQEYLDVNDLIILDDDSDLYDGKIVVR